MLTLKESDGMNVMISSILDIGRTEGAQFEQAKNIDLVEFIKYKTNDYNMLAAKKSITIKIKKKKIDDKVTLNVIDEGIGIDENIDVFAPFKKVGKENGVGLGLYLAKIASDALNAKISIKNREDGKNGAIAKLELNL